ncbi:MAG: hypothetical protein ABI415_01860 [Flavitalea sp.]
MLTKDKLYRKAIQLLLGLEKWHNYPLTERPYAQEIIKYCNTLPNRNSYAEIGCGVGDIVRSVDFKNRIGFDNNKNVLRAAKFFPVHYKKGSSISYQLFHFPDTILKGTFNVLALVNWIHHIESLVLQKKIEEYFNNNVISGGEIIVDTVKDPSYKYNHSIQILTNGLNCSVHKIGSYDRGREVWSIKKLN